MKLLKIKREAQAAVDDGLSCENVAQDLMPKFADVVGDSHQGFVDPKADPVTTDSVGFIHTEGVVAEKNSVNDESSQNVVSLTQDSTFSTPPDGLPSQKNLGLPNDSDALTPMKRGPTAEGTETAELIPLKGIKIEKP